MVLNVVENVSSKDDHGFQRLIKVVAFESELKLSDVLTCNTFVVESKQFLSDDKRIDVVESDREENLTVSLQFVEHF